MEPEEFATPCRLVSSSDFVSVVEVCRQRFALQQKPSSGSHGKVVWEGAISLAMYMEHNPKQFCRSKLTGKRAIELGSGCGLMGLTLSSLGCDVVVTDLADVVPLLQANVSANAPAAALAPRAPVDSPAAASECDPDGWGPIRVAELNWGITPLEPFSPPYDLILGSDVVYSEKLIPVLLNTVHSLAGPRSVVYLANEFRCSIVSELFVKTARTLFSVRLIPSKRQHPTRVNPYMHIYELSGKKAAPE